MNKLKTKKKQNFVTTIPDICQVLFLETRRVMPDNLLFNFFQYVCHLAKKVLCKRQQN